MNDKSLLSWMFLLGGLYLVMGGFLARQTIHHAELGLTYFDEILSRDNLKNNGAIFLDRFDKEHPLRDQRTL